MFTRPSYQGSLPAGSTAIPASARGVPDISMDASCPTWVVVLDTAPGFGGYYGVCGTSAASPMFSGVVAIADQCAGRDLGQINGALYELASSSSGSSTLFDVTDGNNVQAGTGIAGYPAGAGWDAVTGLDPERGELRSRAGGCGQLLTEIAAPQSTPVGTGTAPGCTAADAMIKSAPGRL